MYNMKVKKALTLLLLVVTTLMLTSCNKATLINEVINRNVTYEEHISILDFEDALVEAASIASDSSIAIVAKSGIGILSTESFGSGVVIKKEEIAPDKYLYYALTNRHVVLTDGGKEKSLTVRVNNAEDIKAEICVFNQRIDVAIIKFETGRIINPAKICLDEMEAGRFVVAVGNPYELDDYHDSVTVGNISYSKRTIKEEDVNGNDTNNSYIQHTAPINAGNSGGGLYNIKGELIGINTWKIVEEDIDNMNFSVPLTEIYYIYSRYFE